MTPLPMNTMEKPSRGEAAGVLLSSHCKTSADVFHVCLVRCLLGCGQEGPAEGVQKKGAVALYPPE